MAPNATLAWRHFFDAVKQAEEGTEEGEEEAGEEEEEQEADDDGLTQTTPPSRSPSRSPPPLTLNASIKLLWTAHIHSLHEGLPMMEPLLPLLPSAAEARFGVQWANLVDFVAALQFDVDFNRTNFLQGLIVPPRLLTDADRPPFVRDFSGAQNRALVVAALMAEAMRAPRGRVLGLFRRACCTATGRADAYGAMLALLQGELRPTVAGLIKVLEDLVRSHPCP